MNPRRRPTLCTLTSVTALIAALALTTASLAPAHVAAAGRAPASLHGTGTWVNDGICAPLPTPPPGADLACRGRTIWHGPLLTGTTTYTASGAITPAGDIIGTVDEIFTGSATSGVQGTIHFTEYISLKATGAIIVVANAVGGTGGFCHVRGHLVFTGKSGQNGIGKGPYSGRIVTPKNCR